MKPRRGRPPVTGRHGSGAVRRFVHLAPHEAEIIRLAAEGLGETDTAYITRVALERARRDLTG